MNCNFKTFLIILPACMVSLVGWIMVVVFFGKLDRKMSELKLKTDTYIVVKGLPFWLFAFGVPLANSVLALYAVTSNRIVGVIAEIIGTACALSVGSCIYIIVVDFAQQSEPQHPPWPIPEGFFVAGLIGSLLSMLSLVAMMAFMPFAKGFLANTNRFGYNPAQFSEPIS